MSGWKDWAIGEVVTESDFQSFVQDQVVQRYTDATDRDNTLGANVATGMAAYLETEQLFQVYDGSAWVEISGSGTQISDTPPSDPDVGDTWWDSTNGKFYVYFDSYWVQVQLGEAGPQGESGVLAVTSPITYDAGTSTVGIDETAIAIDQDQVTGLANGTSGYSAVSDGSTLTYQPVSHNYIINGAFDIWQRGGTATVGVNQTKFTADRWRVVAENGAAATVIKQTEIEVPGLGIMDTLKVDFTANASNSGTNLRYTFSPEEINKDFEAKTMKLSFYARANRTINTRTAGFFFPSGFITSNSSYTFTTSWQRFTADLSFPADVVATGNGWLQVVRDESGGIQSGDWWEIAGVQLEAGSVATPFKRNAPSLQGELAACQRYFLRLGNTGGTYILGNSTNRSTTQTYHTRALPTTMRSSPTLQDKEISVADAKGNSWNNLSLTDLTIATSAQESVTFIGEVASGLVAGEASAILFGSSDYVDLDAEL